MVPFGGLAAPGIEGHRFRCNDQHLVNFQVVVLQDINRCQGTYRLSETHVKEQGAVSVIDDELCRSLLVFVWLVFHSPSLSRSISCIRSDTFSVESMTYTENPRERSIS